MGPNEVIHTNEQSFEVLRAALRDALSSIDTLKAEVEAATALAEQRRDYAREQNAKLSVECDALKAEAEFWKGTTPHAEMQRERDVALARVAALVATLKETRDACAILDEEWDARGGEAPEGDGSARLLLRVLLHNLEEKVLARLNNAEVEAGTAKPRKVR